jgi:hypothetical protein
MRNTSIRSAVLAVLLAASADALACGACVEDKMAAAYEHVAVARTLGQNRNVAFFHLEGALVAGGATKRALEKIAQSSAGVDKGGVRASVESASLAVAFDPRHIQAAALQKDLERRLAPKKLSLQLMQVLERPGDVNPSVARALTRAPTPR